MANHHSPSEDDVLLGRALQVTIRVGIFLLLVAWCFTIVRPFLVPVVWGIIIAVGTYRLFGALQALFGGHSGLAAVVYVILGQLVLILPALLLAGTLVDGVEALAGHLADGTLQVPPPPPEVRSWPLIGGPLHRFWQLASTNLHQALAGITPQLTAAGHWLLDFIGTASLGILQFVIAIFIAAALLVNATGGARVANELATGLAGTQGRTYADLAVQTIRSVARGIIGVALIQSILAGLGFLAVGLPAAGLLALICLLLAIIQLPLGFVLLPVAIYGFTAFDTTTAVIFAVWCVLVSLIDNVLKPLLLGRGVDLPMLVVFIGAIGGLLSFGILGLFVGPVVLALAYTLVTAWMRNLSLAAAEAHADAPPLSGRAQRSLTEA
jgi:predicted PurR-regulated permease PerM